MEKKQGKVNCPMVILLVECQKMTPFQLGTPSLTTLPVGCELHFMSQLSTHIP